MAATRNRRRSFYADLDHLRTCFNALDPENAGYIGLTQLVQIMPNAEESAIFKLLEDLDRDKDGKVSFDDFVWLFKLKRDVQIEKQQLNILYLLDNNSPDQTRGNPITNLSHSDSHDMTAVENVNGSPLSSPHYSTDCMFETGSGSVFLRLHRPTENMPSKMQQGVDIRRHSLEKSLTCRDSPATDLASQMKYLTDSSDAVDRSQLKGHSSKVLSCIESGDLMFEDTSTDLPASPISPAHKSAELEVSHVESILECACNSKEIDSEAIMKLCALVKADSQEQQELLALLKYIDQDKSGHVTITEFSHGLQSIRNSALVGSSAPKHSLPLGRCQGEAQEAFGAPVIQEVKPPPTPEVPKLFTNDTLLTSNESGYVKVEDVVTYWHDLGIEVSHDQNLEKIIIKALPVDSTGQINISDLTAYLEESILTEERPFSLLRQIALKSFKKEISTLKTQVHHMSLERDKFQSSLNRTIEEKKRIIEEGDEHIDTITEKSEKIIKEQQNIHIERVKEVEKIKREEVMQIQERASCAIKELEEKVNELKREEEKLREDLKFATDDSNVLLKQLNVSQSELCKKVKKIEMLQKELENLSGDDLKVDESQITELEIQLTYKNAQINGLQDKLREIQDACDELKAENEKMKQKYISKKRVMQKSRRTPSCFSTASKKRYSSGDGSLYSNNRPRSGSHFHRCSRTSHPLVSTTLVNSDLAGQKKNPSVLLEEEREERQDEVESAPQPLIVQAEEMGVESDDEFDGQSSGSSDAVDMDDDSINKSNVSLMEELQQEMMDNLEQTCQKGSEDEECKGCECMVKKLDGEMLHLQEVSESQQDQRLDLEEGTAQLTAQLNEAHHLAASKRKSQEVEFNMLSHKVENSENAATRLEYNLERVVREDMRVEENHKKNVKSVEMKVEAELLQLKTKLMEITDSVSDENFDTSEMMQLQDLLEKERQAIAQKSSEKVAELEEKHAEEMDKIRYKFKMTVEKLHKQLNASENVAEDLKEMLVARIKEQKSQSSKLDTMYVREAEFKDQITAFQVSVEKLENDAVKLKKEMSQMKSTYQSKKLKLNVELNKDVDTSDVATLQSTRQFSSTSSEIFSHGDIISKMQCQLGKLHKVLDTKVSSVVDEDLEGCRINLIHEILANASILDTELVKIKSAGSVECWSHKQTSSMKDEALHNLRAEMKKQKDNQNKTECVFSAFSGEIEFLQGRLHEIITTCENKIDKASKKLVLLITSFRDNDLQPKNAAKSLLFDLHQSQHDMNTLKKEIAKLHSELVISHDKLNKSQDLQMVTDEEVNELQLKLELLAHQRGDTAVATSISSQNVKVDADSGQVITEQEDTQIRDSLLHEKEEIIHLLRAELESLKFTERQAGEEANRKLLEKEREGWERGEETKMLQRVVEQFEYKLQNECSTYADKVQSLTESLQLAKKEVHASQEKLKSQQEQAQEKHTIELEGIGGTNRQDARKLYFHILEASGRMKPIPTSHILDFSHSQLIQESTKEIIKLNEQLSENQRKSSGLESSLIEMREEHEILDTQFIAEHEEEVRALKQQREHLMQQFERLKEQNTILQKELASCKLDKEKKLKKISYLGEEKKILMDIIEQLCTETGRRIDIV